MNYKMKQAVIQAPSDIQNTSKKKRNTKTAKKTPKHPQIFL